MEIHYFMIIPLHILPRKINADACGRALKLTLGMALVTLVRKNMVVSGNHVEDKCCSLETQPSTNDRHIGFLSYLENRFRNSLDMGSGANNRITVVSMGDRNQPWDYLCSLDISSL